MPLPLVPLAIGASALLGGASSILTNKSQQRYNERMYGRQRMDSLLDWNMQNAYNNQMWEKQNAYDLKMWHMQNDYMEKLWDKQNAYDSPAAQMARYRDAGINPNAVFGNVGSGGGSLDPAALARESAPTAAAKFSPNMGSYHPTVPMFDITNGIMSMYDAQAKKVAIDNSKKQGQLLDTEIILKTLDVTGKQLQNESSGLNNNLLKATMDYSVDALAENVRKLKIDNWANTNAETRAQQLHGPSLTKLGWDILNASEDNKLKISTREAQDLQKTLMQYEIHLNEMGVQKSDGIMTRTLGKLWNMPIYKNGNSLSDEFKNMSGKLRYFGK